MMTVCAKKESEKKDVVFCFVFNVHMITLQLLVNQECLTTNLGSYAKQLDLLETTRVTTCAYVQLHKILRIFSLF